MISEFDPPQENQQRETHLQGLIFSNQKTLRGLHNRLESLESDTIEQEILKEFNSRSAIQSALQQPEVSQSIAQEESQLGLIEGVTIPINGDFQNISLYTNNQQDENNGLIVQDVDIIRENRVRQKSQFNHTHENKKFQKIKSTKYITQNSLTLAGVFKWGLTVLRFKRLFMLPVERKRDRNKITPSHFNMIGDKTYQYGEFTHKGDDLSSSQELAREGTCLQRLISCVSDFLQCLPIVLPNQKYKILWDCFYQLLILYRMFVVTIKLSFYLTDLSAVSNFINSYQAYAINIAFIVDVLLNLQTGFYDRGQIVLERPRIMRKYFDQFFVRDLLSQTPMLLGYFVTSDSSYSLIVFQFILEWLIFLQYRSLQRVYARVERALMENPTVAMYLPIVNLYLQIVIMCHVLALIYHLIAVYEIEVLGSEQTWLNIQGVVGEVWYIKYLRAYYWAGCTVINIILYLPESNLEIMFAILTIFFTFWVFGNTINTVDEFRRQTGHREREINAERHLINAFISKRGIESNLKERIQMYVEYKYEEGLEHSQQEEEAVLRKLSPQLQREVLQAIYAEAVQRFPFVRHFSARMQGEAMMKIREELYQPGAVIYDEGDVGESCVYIIKKGVVELSVINKKLKYLQENDQFGMVEFMIGGQRNCTARAKDACTLIKMRRDDFQAIIHENQDDYERFCELRDDLMHRTTNVYVSVCCYVCGAESHSHAECPEVKYVPPIKRLIYDYNHMHSQIRSTHQRQDERTVNALMGREEMLQTIEELQNAEDSEIIQGIEVLEDLAQQGMTESMVLEALDELDNQKQILGIPKVQIEGIKNNRDKEKEGTALRQCDTISEIDEKYQESHMLDKSDVCSNENSSSQSSSHSISIQNYKKISIDQSSKEMLSNQSLAPVPSFLLRDGHTENAENDHEIKNLQINKKKFQNDSQLSINALTSKNKGSLDHISLSHVQDNSPSFEKIQNIQTSWNNHKIFQESLELLPHPITQLTAVNQEKTNQKIAQKGAHHVQQLSNSKKKENGLSALNKIQRNETKNNTQELSEQKNGLTVMGANLAAQIPDKQDILQKMSQMMSSNMSRQNTVLKQHRQSQLMQAATGALGLLPPLKQDQTLQQQTIMMEKQAAESAAFNSAYQIDEKSNFGLIKIDQLHRRRVSIMKNQMQGLQSNNSQKLYDRARPSSNIFATSSALQALSAEYCKQSQRPSEQIQVMHPIHDKQQNQFKDTRSILRLGSEQTQYNATETGRLLLQQILENFHNCKIFKYYKPQANYLIIVEHLSAVYKHSFDANSQNQSVSIKNKLDKDKMQKSVQLRQYSEIQVQKQQKQSVTSPHNFPLHSKIGRNSELRQESSQGKLSESASAHGIRQKLKNRTKKLSQQNQNQTQTQKNQHSQNETIE